MKKLLLAVTTLLCLNNSAFASEYYKEFMFKTNGECHDHSIWFEHTGTHSDWTLGKNVGGKTLKANLDLQLFEDGSFYSEYSEIAYETLKEGHVNFTKAITGTWYVNSNNQLVLAGLGIASPTTEVNGSNTINAMSFQMSAVINDQRVLGKSVVLGHSGSNVGPRGISINQYCRFE